MEEGKLPADRGFFSGLLTWGCPQIHYLGVWSRDEVVRVDLKR